MLSRAQIKYIRSLASQKYRDEDKVFVVEGVKLAAEWLVSTHKIVYIVAVNEWLNTHRQLLSRHKEAQIIEVEPYVLQQISQLNTANQVLMVVRQPEQHLPERINNWCIGLENLQDPGNMGTIIRIADWFGIPYVVRSPGCAEVYNSKVVQAAMGGHLRVQIVEMPLEHLIERQGLPVYAATLNGDSLFALQHPQPGVILIGNESKGLTAGLQALATHRITIPRIGGAESLNAGVSAGIICAQLTRA
ncbi:MAG: RNA methyltransferase [Chitinophagia bacterium]|nr:RNA methyltransferase [Chitinophagia bacterium]